jgi:hypothetical protein
MTKKTAPTTDFFVFPRTLEAMRLTAIPSGGALAEANHVPTTMPQLSDAGRVKSRREPSMGITARKMPVKHRVVG